MTVIWPSPSLSLSLSPACFKDNFCLVKKTLLVVNKVTKKEKNGLDDNIGAYECSKYTNKLRRKICFVLFRCVICYSSLFGSLMRSSVSTHSYNSTVQWHRPNRTVEPTNHKPTAKKEDCTSTVPSTSILDCLHVYAKDAAKNKERQSMA